MRVTWSISWRRNWLSSSSTLFHRSLSMRSTMYRAWTLNRLQTTAGQRPGRSLSSQHMCIECFATQELEYAVKQPCLICMTCRTHSTLVCHTFFICQPACNWQSSPTCGGWCSPPRRRHSCLSCKRRMPGWGLSSQSTCPPPGSHSRGWWSGSALGCCCCQ